MISFYNMLHIQVRPPGKSHNAIRKLHNIISKLHNRIPKFHNGAEKFHNAIRPPAHAPTKIKKSADKMNLSAD